ncbi:MAG: hypothetical protein ACMG6E_06205, partial [Candidatus Roizmanbacteria bacterium]
DGFHIDCGVDITYGWVVGLKSSSQPTSSVLAPTLTTQNRDSTYELSIKDKIQPDSMCFMSVDTNLAWSQSTFPHCRTNRCMAPNGTDVQGIVVDYANSGLAPLSTISWQSTICNGYIHGNFLGLIGPNKDQCSIFHSSGNIESLPEKSLISGSTLRCFWDTPSNANNMPLCRILSFSDDRNSNTICSSEQSRLTHPLPTTAPPLPSPTQSGTSNVTPFPTPQVQSAIKNGDIELNWNFTKQVVDGVDKRDTLLPGETDQELWGLKIGICDAYDSADYLKLTKKAGGTGASCKWYNTLYTSNPIKRDDKQHTLHLPEQDITLDYDNNPILAGKEYYVTCQYYAVRYGLLGLDSIASDSWRRCKPKKIVPGGKVVFENILGPLQFVADISQDVILSDGGYSLPPPQKGDVVIPVEYVFTTHFENSDLDFLKATSLFRPVICDDSLEPDISKGDRGCSYFEPVTPLPKATSITSIFSVDKDGKKLVKGHKYKISCQFRLDAAKLTNQKIKRCKTKTVIASQDYSDVSKLRMLEFNAFDDAFFLPSNNLGIIPLSLSISGPKAGSIKSVTFDTCSISFDNKRSCTKKDVVPLQQTADEYKSTSTLTSQSSLSQVKSQQVSCNLNFSDGSQKNCGQKDMTDATSTSFQIIAKTGGTILSESKTAVEACDLNKDGLCNALDVARCFASSSLATCDTDGDKEV